MPVAAIIEEKIFCMHGGLSPELHNLSQISSLPRPTEVPESGLLYRRNTLKEDESWSSELFEELEFLN